jgi:PQQ-like domain
METDQAMPPNSSLGPFLIGELVSSTTHELVYEASEPGLGRNVLLRVATAESAPAFAADARRIAAVSHPSLVTVLATSTFEDRAYAAIPQLRARSLRELLAEGPLTTARAAHIARGVAAASEALAAANLRVPIDLDTVVVAASSEGERGLLDPLRAQPSAGSRLAEADTATSTRELADLLDETVDKPSDALRRVIDAARSGVHSRPAELATALSAIPPPAQPHPRGRRSLLVGAGALAVAGLGAGIALIVATRDSGERTPKAPATAARVVARIPLGLSGKEAAASFAISGDTVWVTTSQGRLVRVDARSNQVVGAARSLNSEKQFITIASGKDSLWVAGGGSRLLRLNPKTGRVTGRLDLKGRGFSPVGVHPAGGILWLPGQIGTDGSKWAVLRVDPARMRPLGEPLPAPPLPFVSAASGRHAWLIGLANGVVARFDASSDKSAQLWSGPAPVKMAVDGTTLWVADGADSTVTAIDGAAMRFTREAIQTKGFAVDVAVDGPDLWVTTSTAQRGTGRQTVQRIDARTGRRAGPSIEVTREVAMGVGLGSVWVLGANALMRLAPTEPRPALAPARTKAPSPRPLQAGPLAGGAWKANRFVVPFTLELPAFNWVATVPARDGVAFGLASNPDVQVNVSALTQVFTTATKLEPVGSPSHLLTLLRANPHLTVSSVRQLTIDGQPALGFTLKARNPVMNVSLCGAPCVPLFPFEGGTSVALAGAANPTILLERKGHVIAIGASSDGAGESGRKAAEALLRTLHFTSG